MPLEILGRQPKKNLITTFRQTLTVWKKNTAPFIHLNGQSALHSGTCMAGGSAKMAQHCADKKFLLNFICNTNSYVKVLHWPITCMNVHIPGGLLLTWNVIFLQFTSKS